MKTVIKVSSLKNARDIANVKTVLSQEEGVLAMEIKKSTNSIVVVHDENYIKGYDLEDIIEGVGFIII